MSAVGEAAWFALPKIFHYGVKFDISSILAFIPAYVVSLIGTVGIMMAIGEASNQKISSERAANGVLADGVGSLIAGVFWCWSKYSLLTKRWPHYFDKSC